MSNTATYKTSMADGNAAMQTGNDAVALQHFKMAGTYTEDAVERSSALQMCCVVLSQLGRIAEAIEFGDAALKLATESRDNTQLAHCKQLLGATHHKQGVRLALRGERGYKFSRRHFQMAHRYFKEAERYYGRRREVAATTNLPVEVAVYSSYAAMSRGMRGLLYVDMDTYSSLSLGDKVKGRQMIRQAGDTLRRLEAPPSLQADILIMLMRASNFGVRLSLLGRGLALTNPESEAPGNRKQLLTALAGNTFCNWATFHNISVTDEEMERYEQELQKAA